MPRDYKPKAHRKERVFERTICGHQLANVALSTDKDDETTCGHCLKEMAYRDKSGLFAPREECGECRRLLSCSHT